MRNPLKNEETAFRFVLGTIAYFALIVLASWIATWLGVVVFVVAHGRWPSRSCAAAGSRRPPTQHVDRAAVEDTRRILVVANETLEGARLREEIVRMADGVAEDVLVVCPALNSHAADVDVGRGRRPRGRGVEARSATLDELSRGGVNVRGEIGDGDPLAGARGCAARVPRRRDRDLDPPGGPSHWLERGVVEAAQRPLRRAGHARRSATPSVRADGEPVRTRRRPRVPGYLPATLET